MDDSLVNNNSMLTFILTDVMIMTSAVPIPQFPQFSILENWGNP